MKIKANQVIAVVQILLQQNNKTDGRALLQPMMDQILSQSVNGTISIENLNRYSNFAQLYVQTLPLKGNEALFVKYLKPLYASSGEFFFADAHTKNGKADKPLENLLFYNYAMALLITDGALAVAPVLASYTNGEAVGKKRSAELIQKFSAIKNLESELEKFKTAESQFANQQLFSLFLKSDLNGKIWGKSAFKNKYLVLDFWGSWCLPCRASHPHLKELYAKYKDKGLEIVGIASEGGKHLENSMYNWKKAISEDGLPWLQFLDDQDAEQFSAVKAFNISSFPTKILIDQDGRIIGRYGENDPKFDEKLAALLK